MYMKTHILQHTNMYVFFTGGGGSGRGEGGGDDGRRQGGETEKEREQTVAAEGRISQKSEFLKSRKFSIVRDSNVYLSISRTIAGLVSRFVGMRVCVCVWVWVYT